MNTTNPLQLIPYRARRAVLLTSIVIGIASPYILTGLHGWAATALSTLMAITALFSNTQSLSNLTPDSMNQAIQEARINSVRASQSDTD